MIKMNQRAASFLKQRILLALQIENAACVPWTVGDRCVGKIYRKVPNNCLVGLTFSTGRSAWVLFFVGRLG